MARGASNMLAMPFSPGDEVHVALLGKGVVREALNGGRYRVELKGRTVAADERQLTAVSARRRRASTQSSASPEVHSRRNVPISLDLHGLTVEEALPAADAFISDALLAGHPEVRLIHGKSGGRLRSAIHARLTQLKVPSFRLDPGNSGVTVITL